MKLTALFQSLVCAEAWRSDDAPDELFAYVPAEAKGKGGKKSLRKFPLASVAKKGLDPAILRNALARFSQADLPAGAKAGVKSKIMGAIKRWNAAHPSQKIEVSEKSGGQEVCGCMYAGCTMAAQKYAGTDDGTADNHNHAIMSNGTVMPTGGHSHGLEILSIDLGEGVLCAVTTSAYDYLEQPAVPGDAASVSAPRSSGKMYEHRHIVRLTKDSASDGEVDVTGALRTAVSCPCTSGGSGKDMQMTRQEVCADLRTRAAAIKEADAAAAAMLEKHATELEQAASADSVDTIIAGKIKEGALVTKEAHEQAVSAAKQAGKDELQKEISAKEAAAKAQADATKTRLASVVSAGLKPETPLGKDRTIQSVVSGIPVGPEGDKAFAERLEDWSSMLKAAKATKPESAASADGPNLALHPFGVLEPKPEKPETPEQQSRKQRIKGIL